MLACLSVACHVIILHHSSGTNTSGFSNMREEGDRQGGGAGKMFPICQRGCDYEINLSEFGRAI